MPRPLDAEARAARVLNAVWAVAARDGLDAVTARAVATEAGLSLGSVTRAYPRQQDLHVAALRQVSDRVRDRLSAAARAPDPDPRRRAEQALAHVLPLTEETFSESLVYYAYLDRSRSSPELREVGDELDQALRELCEQAVEAVAPGLAPADSHQHAHDLHAFTEGLAFSLVTWPHRRSTSRTREALARWLDDLVTRRSGGTAETGGTDETSDVGSAG